ncbi:MAG: type I 3-dehydroquinate dehydratase [Candidatus Bathyarchaeota archaeon]
MTVKICAAITAITIRDMGEMIKKAERDGADLIEVRLDYMRGEYSLKEVRELAALPLIATNRPLREGGLFRDSEEKRVGILASAAGSDFEFIDIELSTEGSGGIVKMVKDAGAEVIISSHISNSTPSLSALNLIFKKELSTHADICKIVTSATAFRDNLTCLSFVEKAYKKANVLCFCMGELGVASRLLSPLLGGYFTYASVEKGKESASGQLTVAELRSFYEILGV